VTTHPDRLAAHQTGVLIFAAAVGAFPRSGASGNAIPIKINQPPRRHHGKQGKRGLDRFTEGRQRHDLDGDGRAEQRELLLRHTDSGTTPEELIAAAHASCFSMALGAQLGAAGYTPEKIETSAAVTLGKVGDGFAITKIALTTTASVPGASEEAFAKAAADAKGGCPISKLFANNTEILLDAKLV
jgi:osmotically inducible protein OsmC